MVFIQIKSDGMLKMPRTIHKVYFLHTAIYLFKEVRYPSSSIGTENRGQIQTHTLHRHTRVIIESGSRTKTTIMGNLWKGPKNIDTQKATLCEQFSKIVSMDIGKMGFEVHFWKWENLNLPKCYSVWCLCNPHSFKSRKPQIHLYSI